MIARLWRGRVPAALADEYRAYQEEVGPPGYRPIAGVRRIYMLGRAVDEFFEIAMLTFWDSLAAVRAFAGDAVDRARYYDRDFDFLVDPPEHVEHFAVLATAKLVDRPDTPERVARLYRTHTSCAGGRHATFPHDSPAFTTVGNRGAYLLGRDVGSGYEVATVELWDSVNAAGPLPATAEAFDVLVREVIAAPQ